MRSPALAFAWEFGRRHRWGLIAVAGYVIALATIKLVMLETGQAVDLAAAGGPEIPERFAFTVIVPLTSAFMYLLAVFSFGLSGDLAARQSLYPARRFALPVTTDALVGWPMFYGTVAVAGLWLITATFALRPSGIDVPLVWPALFAATFLVWTQVLTWMPYGLPGVRVIAAVLVLAVADTVAVVALYQKPAEILMVAFLAPQLVVAYFAARYAVARARRGDVPDWRAKFARVAPGTAVRPRRRSQFASAARAQLWFEWRRHGWSLPGWVAILLPFELALLFIARYDVPSLLFYTLFGVLLTPPFMAAFTAQSARKSNPQSSDGHDLTPFNATRPVTSAALVDAKLKAALGSTLVTWLLVLIAIPLALTLSGTWPMMMEPVRRIMTVVGMPRAIVFLLLVLSALIASTWKQLVQSLYIGLSGREWLIKLSVSLTIVLLIFIEPIAQWIHDNSGVQSALWHALRWIPAVLVCIKLSAAAWITTRLYDSRLLSDRALVIGAAGWLVTVLALYGVLVWLVATPHIPRYFLALIASLAVPLARLSAAPLALAWNRHR